MKKTLQHIGAAACLSLGAILPLQASAIELSHTSTTWAGQGMCSAEFTFDSGGAGDTIKNLRVGLSAIDPAGNNIDTTVLEVYEFGSSNTERYATAFWESDLACDNNLTLVITSANAVINDERHDLLKNNELTISDFKPFSMRFANGGAISTNTTPQPYTNAEGVTCEYPLDEKDANALWQQMQSNPNAYLQQCTESFSQIAIQYGGMPEAEAQAYAKDSCIAEIEEAKACMAQPGLVPQLCLCGSDI